MASNKDQMDASERIRHAAWAGLIALILAFSTVLEPLDQLTMVTQSRLASFEASGEIAYIGSTEDLAHADFPERRVELAETLDTLRAAGVTRVFVEPVFEEPTTPSVDARLNQALRAFDSHAFLARNKSTDFDGSDRWESSTDAVGDGIAEVGIDRWQNYLGYVWRMPFSVSLDGERLPSMAAELANMPVQSDIKFNIDYGFELSSVPSYRMTDLLGPDAQAEAAALKGKTVIIGNSIIDEKTPNIPGYIKVPTAMVDIFAAESLRSGHVGYISGYLVLLLAMATLCLVALVISGWMRKTAYAMLALTLPASIVVAANMGMKISIAGALVMLLVYGLFRLRNKWRRSFRLVDADTGLPTFAALEADKDVSETAPTIIVAKIHRFEEVRKTLPGDLHSEYMIRIIARLKAAKKDATIYVGPGHLIAWTIIEKEPALIKEHLEGLRALFSSPLLVGENQVDVGITFGVDITPSPAVTKRLAAAVDAAENTTETYDPIAIAEMASDEDLIWNISLQARIDSALQNGEIYLIYQPKILVQTGELVGVEALVRWRDPIKGLIPPDHFIRQCENTGRMAHLTRHVLREACLAGNAFEDRGISLPIAVNISATLVHERDIVQMVRSVLEETAFDPHLLTLEITETYRISNFDNAREILSELAALGPKISMDDFGVGAASLEALQQLPFSELKIDRTFTQAMKDNEKAAGIVRNVLQLGKDLRIIVVAEGVEDEATLTKLRESGCVVAQGFGISRPVSFDEIVQFQKLEPGGTLRKMV